MVQFPTAWRIFSAGIFSQLNSSIQSQPIAPTVLRVFSVCPLVRHLLRNKYI